MAGVLACEAPARTASAWPLSLHRAHRVGRCQSQRTPSRPLRAPGDSHRPPIRDSQRRVPDSGARSVRIAGALATVPPCCSPAPHRPPRLGPNTPQAGAWLTGRHERGRRLAAAHLPGAIVPQWQRACRHDRKACHSTLTGFRSLRRLQHHGVPASRPTPYAAHPLPTLATAPPPTDCRHRARTRSRPGSRCTPSRQFRWPERTTPTSGRELPRRPTRVPSSANTRLSG